MLGDGQTWHNIKMHTKLNNAVICPL